MKVRLTFLATALVGWVIWFLMFLRRFHSYERISSDMVYGLSFAIAGWLTWLAWTFLAKRKWVAWTVTSLLLILAVVITRILMQMEIWNRHDNNIQELMEGPLTQHAHTFDEAWHHIH